jgi:predicted dienelactone hydrolase
MTTTLLTRRRCLQALGAAAFVAAAPALRAQEPEGRYTTLDFDWADVARQRPVPVRLYLPEQARPSRRAPVVVFSHGIGGSRRGYTWLGRHLAGSGVASLHLQHVGSDRQVWSGSLFGILGRLQDAATDREAVARAEDLRFALDMLLASGLAPRLDAGRIVAAGHSYGANTTLLAVGARVQREGRVVPLRDERVRAAIAISAPPFYGEGDPARILAGVTVPSLHVTATEDVIRIPGYFSGVEDRLAVFEAIGSPRKWLAVYEGGSHSMFTDRAGTGGALLNPQVKAATQALASAFLRSVFDGDDGELRRWPQQHTEILARFTARAA